MRQVLWWSDVNRDARCKGREHTGRWRRALRRQSLLPHPRAFAWRKKKPRGSRRAVSKYSRKFDDQNFTVTRPQ
jgi:hypothetical protein